MNLYNLYDKVDQAFAVFLLVKSVGVTGDEKRNDVLITLCVVEQSKSTQSNVKIYLS